MSGAFNIDIEVGASDSGGKIRIYCASLTDTWNIDHTGNELKQFYVQLSRDDAIKKNKIGLGQCPQPDNIGECELFLSRLGCTSAVLRIKTFHDFLNIPKSVRDGLTYASHKPFGKSLREGYMQKHPRFVRRGGGKKWIRLTKDDRGGSLICYKDENKNSIIASMKIGASTEVQNLKDKGIPNAFVLKSGKRQWVLQASSNRDYIAWQSQLENMLQEFGNKVSSPKGGGGASDDQKSGDISINIGAASNVDESKQNSNLDKLQNMNQALKSELDALYGVIEGMQRELNKLKMKHDENGTGKNALQRKIEEEFAKEIDSLRRDYELQSENLKNEIQELHRQLEAKTAMDSGGSGLSKLFGKGFSIGTEEDLQSEIDAEKKILDKCNEDERASIKFMHKHLHRHQHKHLHTHRHIHLHKDEEENIEDINIDELELVNKHTISHTITHSNTQFQIKKNFY